MLGISHWGLFELSEEEAIAVAEAVLNGDAKLWKCDDTGWLEPEEESS